MSGKRGRGVAARNEAVDGAIVEVRRGALDAVSSEKRITAGAKKLSPRDVLEAMLVRQGIDVDAPADPKQKGSRWYRCQAKLRCDGTPFKSRRRFPSMACAACRSERDRMTNKDLARERRRARGIPETSPEVRREAARKARAAQPDLTPEQRAQRREIGKRSAAALTRDQLSERGRRGAKSANAKTSREQKQEWGRRGAAALTPEQRQLANAIGADTLASLSPRSRRKRSRNTWASRRKAPVS